MVQVVRARWTAEQPGKLNVRFGWNQIFSCSGTRYLHRRHHLLRQVPLGCLADHDVALLAPRVGAAGGQKQDEEQQKQRRCNLPGLSLCSAHTAAPVHRWKNQILDRGGGAARGSVKSPVEQDGEGGAATAIYPSREGSSAGDLRVRAELQRGSAARKTSPRGGRWARTERLCRKFVRVFFAKTTARYQGVMFSKMILLAKFINDNKQTKYRARGLKNRNFSGAVSSSSKY